MELSRPSRGDLREWLIHDEPATCPYIPSQTSRLPLRLPSRPLSAREFAQRLEAGDRRQGLLLYRPSCSACRACQPIRIEVEAFRPSKTQRRVFRLGAAQIRTEIRAPSLSEEKVALYNRHKIERGLLVGNELLDSAGYDQFLVETCVDTLEIDYRVGGELIGVAVADRAADALSAVYFYFDPAFARLSPGTYSILKQVDLCRKWSLRYLYLGFYVAACPSMAYKATYLPHQRLIDGEWRRFEHQRATRRRHHPPS